VQVIVEAWHVVPDARRRIYGIVRSLFRNTLETLLGYTVRAVPILMRWVKHRSDTEAALRLLPPEKLIWMLGCNLPDDQLLACYDWKDLPLQLLPTEMTGGATTEAALLRSVLKTGGSYETFDKYMETFTPIFNSCLMRILTKILEKVFPQKQEF
jgi:hypothetical protein